MEPLAREAWWNPVWDTDAYWQRERAREGLKLAKNLARKDRPRRRKRFKIAKASRRRNRSNA